MFAETRVSIGIGLGGHGAGFYQPPPSYASYMPPCPGPDYDWVDGYWSQNYGRNEWMAGYWNRRPFRRGYEVSPRFDNRFNDRDDRRGFARGFVEDRNRGFDQGRYLSGRDRDQAAIAHQPGLAVPLLAAPFGSPGRSLRAPSHSRFG